MRPSGDMPLTPQESANLELVTRYFAALAAGATGEALARFFAPDVVQEELPNLVTPQGARRDLAAILAGAERGAERVPRQRYELLGALVRGDRVACEVAWSGALATGGELRARLAVFIELRGGRIAAQRNYDCFEPL